MVEWLFLSVPRGCLRYVIVVFPDHTHLLFFIYDLADIEAVTTHDNKSTKAANTKRGALMFHHEILEKIEEVKKEDFMDKCHFCSFQGKVQILETLKDTILSQTDGNQGGNISNRCVFYGTRDQVVPCTSVLRSTKF